MSQGRTEGKWLLVGWDSFEAGSTGDPESAWYEIGRFETKASAVRRAARRTRWTGAVSADDHVYIIDPEGKHWRVTKNFCSACKASGIVERTGSTRFRPKLGIQWSAFEVRCKQCDSREWRNHDEVFLELWGP